MDAASGGPMDNKTAPSPGPKAPTGPGPCGFLYLYSAPQHVESRRLGMERPSDAILVPLVGGLCGILDVDFGEKISFYEVR